MDFSLVYEMIKDAIGLAKKRKDNEIAEKLIEINEKIIALQRENESLRDEITELQSIKELEKDLEMTESGVYVRKSEKALGKSIMYCPACFQKQGKLFPIIRGSMARDHFCSGCQMRY